MASKVAIIGIAQSKYVAASKDALTDMIFETSKKALEDAKLKINDIESVTLAAHDMVDGRAITSMLTAPPAGAYLKDEIRVTEDGAFAVALACLRILTGDFATSLVVSWSKCSECANDTMHKVANLSYDPFFYRPFALNDVTSYAIQAQRYMYKYNITEAQAAQVVVKNRANGLKNELAHLQAKVNVDDVMRSKAVSYPLKALDLPPWSDGTCALVLANDAVAKKSKGPCACITGFGWASDTYYSGDKDLAHLESLSLAANQAYKMAGISNPSKDIDVAEIHDITSFHELMAYEALGFCPEGMGDKYLESGATAINGDLPVNPSGGCLSSNPYTAVGLIRVAEAALQVMGRAGNHQIPRVKTALAHGISGLSAQSNCVIILSKHTGKE
jgi:acetyl-CoA C-acetyltransferase